MRKLFVVALLAVAVVGAASLLTARPAEAAKGNCSFVRCAACPDGYHLSLKWPNCCQCIRN